MIESVTLSTPSQSVTLRRRGGATETPTAPDPAQSEAARQDPDAMAYVPMVYGEFREAPELADLASRIIRKHHLTWLEDLPIVYHWKAKGGSKGGRLVYGKCVKLSGLAQHYAQAPFQIWLAADAVAGAELTNRQLEALLFHELCHIETEEDSEGNVTYAIKSHDLEIFLEEVRLYGAWELDITAARRTFAQLELNLDGAK